MIQYQIFLNIQRQRRKYQSKICYNNTMAITFDNDGKPAYMFKQGETSADGVWYAVGAKVDTSAAYEFTGANSFTNTVLFDDAVTATNGWNNFLNPAARDAALTSPVRGTICFVRQDAGGSPLNQIQSYD